MEQAAAQEQQTSPELGDSSAAGAAAAQAPLGDPHGSSSPKGEKGGIQPLPPAKTTFDAKLRTLFHGKEELS